MRYRYPGSLTPSRRPTKTRDQMNFEFQQIMSRAPRSRWQLRLNAKRLRVLECD